ncbi:PfkB family carbohydrate kinase [Kibdelosporangium philippinense]|uniref:PfkB family carbohydrate kinase n=1 Tax=Kibdelosporangium philippinense TaxID=211113 RepID=A0ABS8Z8H2_9PSEU|nr:PfkB family carbohydrate kinase [Kibdelosporangium philippinense]MCE7003697.1 PfkB family carbohydrate kinase [Kibdelosporangium philippinense]
MNLVVVGDTLLDVDLVGTTTRLCPDAPVPVVDLTSESKRPGGAGLAAMLAPADDVTLVTAIADDVDGDQLRKALGDMTIVAGPSWAATPVKTRVRCDGQSLARIDRGGKGDPVVTDDMLDAVVAADAVLVSDYGRGMTRNERLRAVLGNHRLVVWDPHPRGASPVAGVCLVTPNSEEAVSACGGRLVEAAGILRDMWLADAVVVTTGSDGAVLDIGDGPLHVAAPPAHVVDPCGAGDCFAASVATGLMHGASLFEAVRSGVDAASRFLAAGGVSGVGVVEGETR